MAISALGPPAHAPLVDMGGWERAPGGAKAIGEGELCARGRSLAPTAEAGWLAGSVKVDMKRRDKAEKCGHGTNIGFNRRLSRLGVKTFM
jgi:hypothetical protein